MPTRLLPQHTICLYLAAPDCATHYHAGLLDAADRIHLVRHPARAAQTGWQVSRFLKQQAAADGFSGSPNFSGSLQLPAGYLKPTNQPWRNPCFVPQSMLSPPSSRPS